MPEINPTDLELSFWEALGLIVLVCIFVPLCHRLGLGRVVGYLAAGVAAGTFLTLSFAAHPEELLHFAEFGVVLFLFVIGLEMRPARLWAMRGTIFGVGLTQVLVRGALLAVPSYLFGLSWQASTVIGLGLALSSTALVMQSLEEKGERETEHGRTALSILLFEDLAIVPILLLVSILAPTGETTSFGENLAAVGFGVLVLAALVVVARYALTPMFRLLARSRMTEIMTASALGVVIAASLVVDLAGLSYAMGAFIAGVMLSESAYRHEVEADIEPFRGLFLGLFFVAVGLSLDIRSVADNIVLILVAVPLFGLLKGVAVYAVNRLFRCRREPALLTALALSQHGEFGFVLFSAAAASGLLGHDIASVLTAIVTLSMAVSPLVDRIGRRFIEKPEPSTLEKDFEGAGGAILLIGFGRFGQMAAQPLISEGLPLTIIDHDADRVREAGRFGRRVYFGDGTRRDVLRAAGASEAQLAMVCVEDPSVANRIVALLQREFDHLRLVVRAYDRVHAIALRNEGVDVVVRETADAALSLAREALAERGYTQTDALEVVARIRARDDELLDQQTALARGAKDRRSVIESILPEPLNRHRPSPATARRMIDDASA